MTTILYLVLVYVCCGLATTVAYMSYVGRLISRKYGCSLQDGIARFEHAGTAIENMSAVIIILVTWPRMVLCLLQGKWKKALTEFVEENDYDF